MPIPDARYRVKTTPNGEQVRLAFQGNRAVEAQNLGTGATHTPEEFAADQMKAKRRKRMQMAMQMAMRKRARLNPAEIDRRVASGREDFQV